MPIFHELSKAMNYVLSHNIQGICDTNSTQEIFKAALNYLPYDSRFRSVNHKDKGVTCSATNARNKYRKEHNVIRDNRLHSDIPDRNKFDVTTIDLLSFQVIQKSIANFQAGKGTLEDLHHILKGAKSLEHALNLVKMTTEQFEAFRIKIA